MWSQVGLRKHHYEQSQWKWWNSSWAISNPERWCCESVRHSICQQIWKTQQWPQDWKRSVFIPVPKKGNAKECSNYRIVVLIPHTRKVMLKILQDRLQQYMNCKLPDAQDGFRKFRIPHSQPKSALSWLDSCYQMSTNSITGAPTDISSPETTQALTWRNTLF